MRGEGREEKGGEGKREGRRRERTGGLSGNVAEEAFCLKSAPGYSFCSHRFWVYSLMPCGHQSMGPANNNRFSQTTVTSTNILTQFFMPDVLLMPNQQYQSTEDKIYIHQILFTNLMNLFNQLT